MIGQNRQNRQPGTSRDRAAVRCHIVLVGLSRERNLHGRSSAVTSSGRDWLRDSSKTLNRAAVHEAEPRGSVFPGRAWEQGSPVVPGSQPYFGAAPKAFLAVVTNARINMRSFEPDFDSTPLATSTASGWAVAIASATLNGVKPPASTNGISPRRAFSARTSFQSTVSPVPPNWPGRLASTN